MLRIRFMYNQTWYDALCSFEKKKGSHMFYVARSPSGPCSITLIVILKNSKLIGLVFNKNFLTPNEIELIQLEHVSSRLNLSSHVLTVSHPACFSPVMMI